MGRLRRLAGLPGKEQRLLLAAAVLLAAVRLGLWALPFNALLRATGASRLPSAVGRGRPPAIDRIVWAVATASRCVPGSTCLVRALGARTLLSRYGYSSKLRLGVARRPDGAFEAHAWLEHDTRVLIGGPVDDRYARLPSLEGRA